MSITDFSTWELFLLGLDGVFMFMLIMPAVVWWTHKIKRWRRRKVKPAKPSEWNGPTDEEIQESLRGDD